MFYFVEGRRVQRDDLFSMFSQLLLDLPHQTARKGKFSLWERYLRQVHLIHWFHLSRSWSHFPRTEFSLLNAQKTPFFNISSLKSSLLPPWPLEGATVTQLYGDRYDIDPPKRCFILPIWVQSVLNLLCWLGNYFIYFLKCFWMK